MNDNPGMLRALNDESRRSRKRIAFSYVFALLGAVVLAGGLFWFVA
jgi:hypothetical protein